MKNVHLGFLLLFFGCSETKAFSKEEPTESFRSEVATTEVHGAMAEKKSFDHLINAIGKKGARREVEALVELISSTRTTPTVFVRLVFLSGISRADLQRPLVFAVIGGLTIGTVTALFFIPLMYWFFDVKVGIKEKL